MRIESEKEFWLRQLDEYREIVRQRKLKKLNAQNNPPVNNNTTDQSV
jgi:hypothetical protein